MVHARRLEKWGCGPQTLVMAHLEYSNVSNEAVLVLGKDEVKRMLPLFKRFLKAEKKLEEKYQDIHEGGDATERQENKLVKHQENVSSIESIIKESERLIKPQYPLFS